MSDPGEDVEERVRRCYSTWGDRYYDEYYGEQAPYPPVHAELVRSLLDRHGVRTMLDAGCGPASFIRDLDPSIDAYGFDLTPEMVASGRRVMTEHGRPAERLWTGSVLDAQAFRPSGAPEFDAAVCLGVLPHVPRDEEETVLANMLAAVRPGGLLVAEARNELFGLFTGNRYSHELFVDRLVPVDRLRTLAAGADEDTGPAMAALSDMFAIDEPPIRQGKAGEPGYDEVLSRVHNPLLLRAVAEAAGWTDVSLHYYHFHALPPMVSRLLPRAALAASLEMERDPQDWRGLVMASAFLVVGRRP